MLCRKWMEGYTSKRLVPVSAVGQVRELCLYNRHWTLFVGGADSVRSRRNKRGKYLKFILGFWTHILHTRQVPLWTEGHNMVICRRDLGGQETTGNQPRGPAVCSLCCVSPPVHKTSAQRKSFYRTYCSLYLSSMLKAGCAQRLDMCLYGTFMGCWNVISSNLSSQSSTPLFFKTQWEQLSL
jgi:hypothetical protein